MLLPALEMWQDPAVLLVGKSQWDSSKESIPPHSILLPEPGSPAHGMQGGCLINSTGDSTSLFGFALPKARGGGKGSCEGAVKRRSEVPSLLGEVRTAVQGSALQRGSFKGSEITMAGHIPGGAEPGIKADLKPARPWKAEQVWVVAKKSWRVKEDSL